MLYAGVHPLGPIFRQLLVVAPHVGVIVIQLREQIVQLRGIFRLQGPHHSRFQELPEGIGFFNGRQQSKTAADLVFVHTVLPETRRENSERTVQNASTLLMGLTAGAT